MKQSIQVQLLHLLGSAMTCYAINITPAEEVLQGLNCNRVLAESVPIYVLTWLCMYEPTMSLHTQMTGVCVCVGTYMYVCDFYTVCVDNYL